MLDSHLAIALSNCGQNQFNRDCVPLLTIAGHTGNMPIVHSTAREMLLAQVNLDPVVVARRWEPLSAEALKVVRGLYESPELAEALAAVGSETDDCDA